MEAKNKITRIDLKDRKILFELDFDSRSSNTAIAKKVGSSKQGVDYRIRNLIKEKIILGFYPIIDNVKLGYIYCRVFLKLQNLTKDKEDKVIAELKNEKRINWVLKAEGSYDILFACWMKNLEEFKRFIRELISKYSRYIKEEKESIGIRVVHYQYRFLLGTRGTKKLVFEETPIRVEIAELDKRILKVLCENARAPLVEIANKLKISPKVLAYRIKKLEKDQIILGHRPLINHPLLGYTYYKILFHLMNVTKEEFETFRRYLENHPKVIYIVDEVGICDIDVEAMFESERDYFDFMKELKFKFPTLIKEYETLIGLETLKVNYLPYDL
ncbi:MAG: Lrp/AsnC family transcriptional regulator [Candidatus Aenigmarchaeota archaeon]|nr:Lrp/AsnC family transcriptional regulator [Candidatus Aenigmarchaeota archaeon]